MNPASLTRTELEELTRIAVDMFDRGQRDARRGLFDISLADGSPYGAAYRRGHHQATARIEAELYASRSELQQRQEVCR